MFLGLDIGTSAVKALLVDEQQRVVADASVPLDVSRPQPLWSEQDPAAWWAAVEAATAILRQVAPRHWSGLRGIGLSGQMHGAVVLDRAGRVLRPAILWNDGRAEAECLELARRVPDLDTRAGNLAMPGFTAPKLLWLATHEPEIFAATATVLLPKDYIRLRLTGVKVSDMSDASGTLWLDVAGRRWDETLLAATGLALSNMPALVEGSQPSATLLPALAGAWGLPGASIVVAGGGGDNAASAIGIGAVSSGDGFLSIGTSGVLFAVADHFVAAPRQTLHAFCHAIPDRWHGMGVMLAAGAALSWIAALLGRETDVAALLQETEAWASSGENVTHAPIFLPYLSGERTPHNDAQASGLFAGLRLGHGASALTYAVLEGVAFACADSLDVLNHAGARLTSCMLVGGGARSPFWAQLLADALGITLEVPDGAERGASFGAARLAMLATGQGTLAEICTRPAIARAHVPRRHGLSPDRRARFQALYPAERSVRPGLRSP